MIRRWAVVVAAGLAFTTGVWSMQQRRVVQDGSAQASQAVVAGGFVFISALLAADDGGRIAEGDIATQTRLVLERLRAVLREAGSSLGQVVTVHVYLRQASDFDAMNTVYREFFTEAPPTRTTVVAGLAQGALVAMSAVAVPEGAHRETLHPAGWVKSPRPYSYIVRAGDFVFLSGLVSRRGRDDQAVPGPVSTQVRTILDNANVLLKTAGLTFANVVTARVFLTDGSYFETMNDEYRKVFVSKPPARATAVTGLMGLDWSVEITLMATSGERDVLGPTVAPSLPLSAAIRTGPFVFLSGVLGNTDTNVSDVAAQTRETLTRIGRTLDTAGLTFADVVENTVYLPDLWQTAAVERVYGEFFSGELPARTVVGASLVTRAGLIEIMTTAVGR